jgi:phosphoribosylformylglycinamidine cyclo-ligase
MAEDAFDLAGFCVGAVDEASLLGPDRVSEGDVVVGLASSGLHANGYSLVRSALLPAFDLGDTPPGLDRPLADELLEPCAIYAPEVVSLARDGLIHAAAHITGGGWFENLPRVLPDRLGVTIHRGTWPEQPIFGLVQEAAAASDDDMFATLNMGIGMLLLVAPASVEDVLDRGAHAAFRIGEISSRPGVRVV